MKKNEYTLMTKEGGRGSEVRSRAGGSFFQHIHAALDMICAAPSPQKKNSARFASVFIHSGTGKLYSVI